MPRAVVDERPHVAVDVLERNPAVVDLARAHFDTWPEEDPAGRVRWRTGNLEDLLAEARGPYDLVLVDTAALAPLGGVDGLSRSAREALLAAVGSGGSLVVGPLAADPGVTGLAEGWRTVEFVRVRPDTAEAEVVRVSRPNGADSWPAAIGAFELRTGERLEG